MPAFLLLAAFALLFAFAGAGPAASGFQGRPEQKLDGREGQFRPFVVSRQDAGRIAHAPRPTSKPALASGGADGLSAAFLAVLAPGYSPRPTPVLAAAALSFRLYPSARPRAPPAFSLSC